MYSTLESKYAVGIMTTYHVTPLPSLASAYKAVILTLNS